MKRIGVFFLVCVMACQIGVVACAMEAEEKRSCCEEWAAPGEQLDQNSATLFSAGPGLVWSHYGHLMPSTGEIRLLVLPIDFPDLQRITAERYAGYAHELYGENDLNKSTAMVSAKAQLYRLSYGKLNIGGDPESDILPIYMAPENSDYYNQKSFVGRSRFSALISDALAFNFDGDPTRNYSDYDADGDGCIDALIVVAANKYGADAGYNEGPECGIKIHDPDIQYANVVECGFQDLDSVSHELGHLMGLEDTYHVDNQYESYIDSSLRDLMSGAPSHLNVYSRYILNWLEPTILTVADPVQSIDLYSADWYGGEFDDSKPRSIILIPKNQDLPLTEFYMLEYRPHSMASIDDPSKNFEQVFPDQPGVLIWHCNTAWSDERYGFAENDYRKPVYRSENTSSFTIDDFYTTGTVFSPETTPSSDFYGDVETGIYVEVVQADGGEYATLNVGFLDILPPEVGDEGFLMPSELTPSGVTFSWAEAEDKQTQAEDLVYTLYYSESADLDTVEQCEAAVEVVSGPALTSGAVTGLHADTTYYFNVVVADQAGNKAAYTKRKVTLQEHTSHDFDGEWQSNGTSHWHECVICNGVGDKTEHIPVADSEVPATCITDGRTGGSHCEVCGYVIEEPTIIPATGHDYSSDLIGNETGHGYLCANCGDMKDLTAHTKVIDVSAISANCLRDGRTEGSCCEVCGYVIEESTVIPATGHRFSPKWAINKTMHWHKCEICGGTDRGEAHAPTVDPAVPATCTEDGKTEGSHCEVCGYVMTPQTAIPHTGHSFSADWTADETGHWHQCANCDSIIDKAVHMEDDGTETKAPTENEMGVMTYTCSVCGHITRTESIPATGKEVLGGLSWRIDAADELTLTGDFPEGDTIWAACWGADGRFLGVRILTVDRMSAQLEPGWVKLKLLWLGKSFAPKGAAVMIER